jgi:hypothetical protein
MYTLYYDNIYCVEEAWTIDNSTYFYLLLRLLGTEFSL